MNLAKEISFLLYKHNCVILPGFGAFLINEKRAEKNVVAQYAMPKQEVINFNKQIINNDGLVANHLSQHLQCSYEEGLKAVENYISELWVELESKRNVEIAEVGTFYYTQESKLVFVPHYLVNFSRESFGLPKLRLKQLVAEPKPATTVIAQKPLIADQAQKTLLPTVEVITESKASEPVASATRRLARQQAAEVKKRAKQIKATRQGTKKLSSLTIINSIGSLFLIGIIAALLNFEMNLASSAELDSQIASLLETPYLSFDSFEPNLVNVTEEEDPTAILPIETHDVYGIYAQVESAQIAEQLKSELGEMYSDVTSVNNDDGTSNVFVISFDSEELAKEYQALLQNKMNHKLVIEQK
ncbi:MAG TPA: hypothetical protein DD396_07105 [Bacteroidetes bacterium]|jgi:nucleoid DNA-binding protein|nr:hypothetical protein [Bacteroidota bacterium]